MSKLSITSVTGTLIVGVGMSGNTAAVTINRDYLSHGTASCQSALPVFDGNIRKRPMAVANEGASAAFVTCDADTINNAGGSRFTQVLVALRNRAGAANVTIDCTLVDGFFTGSTFLTKASAPSPVGMSTTVTWTAADNAGSNFRSPAVSCLVPVGVDISGVLFNYSEEIGL